MKREKKLEQKQKLEKRFLEKRDRKKRLEHLERRVSLLEKRYNLGRRKSLSKKERKRIIYLKKQLKQSN